MLKEEILSLSRNIIDREGQKYNRFSLKYLLESQNLSLLLQLEMLEMLEAGKLEMLKAETLSLARNLLTVRVRSRTDLVPSISLNHETSFCFCRDTHFLAGYVRGCS